MVAGLMESLAEHTLSPNFLGIPKFSPIAKTMNMVEQVDYYD